MLVSRSNCKATYYSVHPVYLGFGWQCCHVIPKNNNHAKNYVNPFLINIQIISVLIKQNPSNMKTHAKSENKKAYYVTKWKEKKAEVGWRCDGFVTSLTGTFTATPFASSIGWIWFFLFTSSHVAARSRCFTTFHRNKFSCIGLESLWNSWNLC